MNIDDDPGAAAAALGLAGAERLTQHSVYFLLTLRSRRGSPEMRAFQGDLPGRVQVDKG